MSQKNTRFHLPQDGRSKNSRHYEILGCGKNLDSFESRGVAIATNMCLRNTVHACNTALSEKHFRSRLGTETSNCANPVDVIY